jgi:hypothetical protein
VNGRSPSAAARSLVARSRRPARTTGAVAALMLAGGTASAPGPSRGRTVPGTAPSASGEPPATLGPSDAAGPLAAAGVVAAVGMAATAGTAAAAGMAAAPDLPSRSGAPGPSVAPGPPGPPATAGPPAVSPRFPAAGWVPAGSPAEVRPAWSAHPGTPLAARADAAGGPGTGPLTSPVSPAAAPAVTSRPARRHDGVGTSPSGELAAVPAIQARVSRPATDVPSLATAVNPLVERAHRPARSAAAPDPGTMPSGAPSPPEPATATAQTPERAPGVTVGPPAAVREVPAHPPVTIGEIHVHVTEPAGAAADPLALLAPYARGLTARRDGAW